MGIIKKLKFKLKLSKYRGTKIWEDKDKAFYELRVPQHPIYGIMDNNGDMLYDFDEKHYICLTNSNYLFIAVNKAKFDVVDLRTKEKIFSSVEIDEDINHKPYFILKSSLSKLSGLFDPRTGNFTGFKYDTIKHVKKTNFASIRVEEDVYIATLENESCVIASLNEFIPMEEGKIQFINHSNKFVRNKKDGRKILYSIPESKFINGNYNNIEVDDVYFQNNKSFPMRIKMNNKVGIFDYYESLDNIKDSSNYFYDDVSNFEEVVSENPKSIKFLAYAKLNGKYGYVNENGVQIIPPIFNGIYNFENGFAVAFLNGRRIKFDSKGKCDNEEVMALIEDYFSTPRNTKHKDEELLLK